MGWQHASSLGQPRNLSPHRPYRSSPPHGRRITFHRLPQGLGRCPETTSQYGLSSSACAWHLRSGNLWHGHSVDKFHARPGCFQWWRLWRCYLPLPPKGPTGHMSSSNCMKAPTICPSPKIDMFASYPNEETESPSGQISQLKIHWLLSARLLVVFPTELNGGDHSVTIDLPKSLHTGCSVTSDEYPYIKVNIPTPVPEEQGSTSPPLGRKHDTPTTPQPKIPWKPRVTLMAEVNKLIDWGMTDNYDQELEHSIMAEVPATEADAILPLKMEMPVLSLDASSQASAAETEASVESNPISALCLQQWLIAATVAVKQHISLNFSQMSIWLSIPCSLPEDLQTLKCSEPSKTLRCHCTRGRWKQLLPTKRPRSPIQRGT